jgi:leader peptidase (prepilin peptidase)/N-methyltransferase
VVRFPLPQSFLFVAALAAATVFDLKRRMIPDSICAVLALAGLMTFSPAKLFGVLAALPFFMAALLKEGSVGGGDVKLTAAAGLTLGFCGGITGVIIALAAELLFAGAANLTGRLRGRRERVKALPLAPFLSAGFLAVHFWKR